MLFMEFGIAYFCVDILDMGKLENQTKGIFSNSLKRKVIVDVYCNLLNEDILSFDLLLINDGQDLLKMNFPKVLQQVNIRNSSLLVVAIHAGIERKQEYGVAGIPDYMQRGDKAQAYAQFILNELMPELRSSFNGYTIEQKYLAGFSLGGLMAFDMAIDYPNEFSAVGVFSGSFWWRSKALDKGYVEELDRIMHAKIRTKQRDNRLRFFLQTGQLDELADRNNNGIIDSIDDTLGIVDELVKLGYKQEHQITYVELQDGKHDIETWGRVMPQFLNWLKQVK
jgi:enterochelin esterase-like enzyme